MRIAAAVDAVPENGNTYSILQKVCYFLLCIELLQTSTLGLLTNATIGGGDFKDFDVDSFCEYYRGKVSAM